MYKMSKRNAYFYEILTLYVQDNLSLSFFSHLINQALRLSHVVKLNKSKSNRDGWIHGIFY